MRLMAFGRQLEFAVGWPTLFAVNRSVVGEWLHSLRLHLSLTLRLDEIIDPCYSSFGLDLFCSSLDPTKQTSVQISQVLPIKPEPVPNVISYLRSARTNSNTLEGVWSAAICFLDACLHFSTVSLPNSSLRPTTITLAPSWAKRTATPAPMPFAFAKAKSA
jgi:hypothetical protein